MLFCLIHRLYRVFPGNSINFKKQQSFRSQTLSSLKILQTLKNGTVWRRLSLWIHVSRFRQRFRKGSCSFPCGTARISLLIALLAILSIMVYQHTNVILRILKHEIWDWNSLIRGPGKPRDICKTKEYSFMQEWGKVCRAIWVVLPNALAYWNQICRLT